MIQQRYDFDADALYVTIQDADVTRTVEIDTGTLVDLDAAGAVVGIEVIRPNRDWPVSEIIARFAIPESARAELRAYFLQPGHAVRPVFSGTIQAVPA